MSLTRNTEEAAVSSVRAVLHWKADRLADRFTTTCETLETIYAVKLYVFLSQNLLLCNVPQILFITHSSKIISVHTAPSYRTDAM